MSKPVKITPDVVDIFCEDRGFRFIKEDYREGEAVVWVINDEGIYEFYTLAYIRRASEDDFWGTPEGILANALETINDICLEDQLSVRRWRH